MNNYPKFAAWAKLREGLADDPLRGTTTEADNELVANFEAMIKRDGGISDAVKRVYKHQMETNPEVLPRLKAIIAKHRGVTPAKAAADPNSAEVTGMDPETGQILDEPKHRAWLKKKKEDDAAKRAAAPADASQSSHVKIKQALNAWVAKIMEHPTNSKIEPERLVKSKSFQDLLDSVGLVGPMNAEMREKATKMVISDIQNKQAQVRDFAKKGATSGPTATPPAAIPVATPAPAPAKKGGFMNWLTGRGDS